MDVVTCFLVLCTTWTPASIVEERNLELASEKDKNLGHTRPQLNLV